MSLKDAFFWVFARILTALCGLAIISIAGSLLVARLLPRGHPLGDRLRALAGRMPSFVMHGSVWVSTIIFAGASAVLLVWIFASL
ncbi:MAG: hypothetical protein EON54_03580 [Alcaligenaceae bacterium]|nr:MAG: hypothetical protein EON54_03580 [Alcaligenaceae bacterium]